MPAKLIWQVLEVEGVQLGVNYGANKLRFPAPVHAGSKVRRRGPLRHPGRGGHQVISRVTTEREGGDKPVCDVETPSIVMT